MKKIVKKAGLLLSGLILLGFINTGHAALIDIGDGLVNDSTLNITWMKDANLFKTLCDAADPIATGFTPVDTADAATVCTNNGRMTWNDAEAWIARLNAQNYRGHNDWRQPITPQPDASCEAQRVVGGFPDQGNGFNCRGSELGHLFNISLGNPNDNGTGATGGTIGTGCVGTFPHCLQNSVPFDNARSFAYWSGSTYAPDPVGAWGFGNIDGIQNFGDKDRFNLFVWPVRSGQSVVAPAAVQNIPTLSVWGLGIMVLLLGLVARRRISGAPCYLTKFRDSCRLNSFTYAANGRCPERPASVTTTHKSRFVITPSNGWTAIRNAILASLARYRALRLSELPCRLSGTKNHHFASAPFP